MRIATLILGLFFSGMMMLQSCTIMGLSGIADTLSNTTENSASSIAAAGGFMAGILALIAVAFVLKLPFVSIIVYLLAALFAFSSADNFPDMGYYGWGLLALAVMSLIGWLGLRKEKKEKQEHKE